ncbi:hypothetical protein L1049_015641 [Liquidambar formosana]|uniref:Uncharacterized protein n=1 Tax=Liquidambar formosana TaxID=63359 RepID=A0AAP0X693_LIQFO
MALYWMTTSVGNYLGTLLPLEEVSERSKEKDVDLIVDKIPPRPLNGAGRDGEVELAMSETV